MKQLHLKFLLPYIFICFSSTLLYAADTNSIRIMPLGDSITYDYRLSDSDNPRPITQRTGYRSHLWYMLENAGYNADFVGSVSAGQAIIPPFDTDNEGHRGWHSFEIAEHTYSYMSNSNPDIVLLHIGTNDFSSSVSGVAEILNQINMYEEHSGKEIKVFVALIIDMQEPSGIIAAFNKNLEKLLSTYMMNGDKVVLVDMYRGAGLTPADYIDRIHPNDNGYKKMAQVWFNALMAPYTPSLYTFPATIVGSEYVTSMHVSEAEKSVTFTTEIPDTGLIF